jgi:hypothetical protein
MKERNRNSRTHNETHISFIKLNIATHTLVELGIVLEKQAQV